MRKPADAEQREQQWVVIPRALSLIPFDGAQRIIRAAEKQLARA